MSEYGQDIVLGVPIHVDVDFEIDADGECSVVAIIYNDDDEDPVEVFVNFEGVVESLIEYHGDVTGYQKLYCLAHEFSRMAARLREKAVLIEDSSSVVNSLFDIDD
jgi:hypothetical protein